MRGGGEGCLTWPTCVGFSQSGGVGAGKWKSHHISSMVWGCVCSSPACWGLAGRDLLKTLRINWS